MASTLFRSYILLIVLCIGITLIHNSSQMKRSRAKFSDQSENEGQTSNGSTAEEKAKKKTQKGEDEIEKAYTSEFWMPKDEGQTSNDEGQTSNGTKKEKKSKIISYIKSVGSTAEEKAKKKTQKGKDEIEKAYTSEFWMPKGTPKDEVFYYENTINK